LDQVTPQWLAVDLGTEHAIDRVEIVWEAAFGQAYAIQVSADGVNYTEAYSTGSGDGATDIIEFQVPINARWIRMYGTQRGTGWGYSIYEFKVFGTSVSN